jgi:hypothetical protein
MVAEVPLIGISFSFLICDGLVRQVSEHVRHRRDRCLSARCVETIANPILLTEDSKMQNFFDLRLWLLTGLDECTYLPFLYKFMVTALFVGFLSCSLSVLRTRQLSESHFGRFLMADLAYVFFLASFIFAGRWPGLLPPELNADESQFLAGAQKLFYDPVYWRAVDVGTSGPLNIYPLMLPALLGMKPEYASARCLALLLVVVSCLSLYFSIKQLYGTVVARLALLPVVTTFALMTARDYVHYSSEHVPMAILSLSLYLICRLASASGSVNQKSVLLIGLMLGSAPYAKLQAAPMAAALACICLHVIWVRSSNRAQALKTSLILSVGLLCFSCAHAVFIITYAAQQIFFERYILQNLWYSNLGGSFFAKAESFVRAAGAELDTRALFGLTAGVVIVIIPVMVGLRRNPASASTETERRVAVNATFPFYSAAFLAASVYAIAQPQRGFHHYGLFLMIPSGFMLGTVLGELRRLSESSGTTMPIAAPLVRAVSGACIAVGFLHFGVKIMYQNRFIYGRHQYREHYATPIAKVLLENAAPGDSMMIWGWSPHLYLETGIVQASNDAVPAWAIFPNTRQDAFVKRFASELHSSNAKLFVDTQAPGEMSHFWMGVRGCRFEDLPEIADVVSREFTVVRKIEGATIYKRK